MIGAARNAIAPYRPLLVALALTLLGAAALALSLPVDIMNAAMGLFLLFLSALQLGDVRGFAASFAKYDLIAARSRFYALAAPFLLATLGALYLAQRWPLATNLVMLVMALSSFAGAALTVRARRDIHCACAGAGTALPVGRVTLVEYGAMALMATFKAWQATR